MLSLRPSLAASARARARAPQPPRAFAVGGGGLPAVADHAMGQMVGAAVSAAYFGFGIYFTLNRNMYRQMRKEEEEEHPQRAEEIKVEADTKPRETQKKPDDR
nr:hypothetical protein TetV2_00223 [Oceanusvirus sp.]